MLDIWNVFDCFEYIGTLTYDTDTNAFHMDLFKTEKYYRDYQYAFGLKWGEEKILPFLKQRIIPPDAVDIRKVLRELGLKHYDAWDIVKKNQLACINDLIWMTKGTDPMEFFHVCPLYLFVKDKLVAENNWPPVLTRDERCKPQV